MKNQTYEKKIKIIQINLKKNKNKKIIGIFEQHIIYLYTFVF